MIRVIDRMERMNVGHPLFNLLCQRFIRLEKFFDVGDTQNLYKEIRRRNYDLIAS